ncbi:MAG: hypothetical protein ACPG5B_03570 [Chitinophagales bacterium]
MIRTLYHTQEYRPKELKQPIMCCRDDAWLGEAYYFWYAEDDAHRWGETSKRRTGEYEIYKASVDCENLLDTVFNEENYLFWLKQIEKVAKTILKKTGMKPSIKEINDYFKERGTWNDMTGIMFQDLPSNLNFLLVRPIAYKTKIVPFVYKKRIQIGIFKINIIQSFKFYKRRECS